MFPSNQSSAAGKPDVAKHSGQTSPFLLINGRVCNTRASKGKDALAMDQNPPMSVNGNVPPAGGPLSLVLGSALVRLGQRRRAVLALGLDQPAGDRQAHEGALDLVLGMLRG